MHKKLKKQSLFTFLKRQISINLPTDNINYILYWRVELQCQTGQQQGLMISCCCLMVDEGWMTTYRYWLQGKKTQTEKKKKSSAMSDGGPYTDMELQQYRHMLE